MKYTLELIEGEYQNRDEAISALNLYRWHRRGQPVIVVYHDGNNDRAIFAIGVKSSSLQSSEPCGLNCYVIIGDGMTVINNIEAMSIDNDTLHYNDNDQVAVNTGALYTAGNGILITEDPENSRFIISASIDNDTIIFNDQGQLCAPGSGGGIAELMENITWENLKQLRDNNSLVPGKQYRIIDYECVTAEEDTKSAGHQFDVIVTADSTNVLNENARACEHESLFVDIEISYIFKGEVTITDLYTYSGTTTIEGDTYYQWIPDGNADDIIIVSTEVLPTLENSSIFDINQGLIPIPQYYSSESSVFDNFTTTGHPDYFSNSKLESWELKYCLDNDKHRFAWASPEEINEILDKSYEMDINTYRYDESGTCTYFKGGDATYKLGAPINPFRFQIINGALYTPMDIGLEVTYQSTSSYNYTVYVPYDTNLWDFTNTSTSILNSQNVYIYSHSLSEYISTESYFFNEVYLNYQSQINSCDLSGTDHLICEYDGIDQQSGYQTFFNMDLTVPDKYIMVPSSDPDARYDGIWAAYVENENDQTILFSNIVESKNGISRYGNVVYHETHRYIPEGKGVIYYMKDEWNNEAPYDFKNIQYKQYATFGENVYKCFRVHYNDSGNIEVAIMQKIQQFNYTIKDIIFGFPPVYIDGDIYLPGFCKKGRFTVGGTDVLFQNDYIYIKYDNCPWNLSGSGVLGTAWGDYIYAYNNGSMEPVRDYVMDYFSWEWLSWIGSKCDWKSEPRDMQFSVNSDGMTVTIDGEIYNALYLNGGLNNPYIFINSNSELCMYDSDNNELIPMPEIWGTYDNKPLLLYDKYDYYVEYDDGGVPVYVYTFNIDVCGSNKDESIGFAVKNQWLPLCYENIIKPVYSKIDNLPKNNEIDPKDDVDGKKSGEMTSEHKNPLERKYAIFAKHFGGNTGTKSTIQPYHGYSIQFLNWNIFLNIDPTGMLLDTEDDGKLSKLLCYSNILGPNSARNTFGSNCYTNVLDGECYKNVFCTNCYGNKLGVFSSNNFFDDYAYDNIMGCECYENAINIESGENTFGPCCEHNILNGGCEGNSFGNNCRDNTLGEKCGNNSFGNNCGDNTFGNYCENNSFGNGCIGNTLNVSDYGITFGNTCISNVIGAYLSYIKLGSGGANNNISGKYITIGENCMYITVGVGVQGLTIFDNTKYCTISPTLNNYVYNAEVHASASGTSGSIRTINFTENVTYTQIAGVDSNNQLVIKNPFD